MASVVDDTPVLSERLAGWLAPRRRVVVLAGAGCSTDSGIPDYRGPQGTWARGHRPIQFGEFYREESRRRRYWARSFLGWPAFQAARPNRAHAALAALEERGTVRGVITQNVDGLHHAAGSRNVIELHGSNHVVGCLGCDATIPRARFQHELAALNPGFSPGAGPLNPDGDMEVESDAVAGFRVPPCSACGGVLKPAVVFFGENVPRPRVDEAFGWVDEADLLLVVGSSLTVWSGYRFALRARERGTPVVILNRGPTRADEIAADKLDAGCAETLQDMLART